jgi:hypothetical protein
VYLGRLPQYSATSIWRELRGYKNYIVIGSEATNHGVQIFDLRKVSFMLLCHGVVALGRSMSDRG